MAQEYRYLPLDETQNQIRLVQLLPSHDEQVHIKLLVRGLTEVAFDALSYNWGVPNALCTINCEGHYMRVTRNLFSCLQSLLRCSQNRPIWIDAISISQMDLNERTHAISQMPLIYHTARRTFCWTECEFGTIGSLSTMLDVGRYQQKLVECFSGHDILHATYKIVESDLERFDEAAKEVDIGKLDAFLNQPYFERIWITQDIVCSHDPILFDGKESIRWNELSQAVFAWLFFSPQSEPRSPATMFVLLCEWMRKRYLGRDRTDTALPELMLVQRSIPASCSDSRDYVYSAYSMANRIPSQPPKSDHESGTKSVYGQQPEMDDSSDANDAYVLASQYINVLSGQPLSLSLTDGPPSDQPSWSTNWEARTKRYLLNRPNSGFSASRRSQFEQFSTEIVLPPDDTKSPRLRYTGLIVDSIQKTSDYMPPRRHCDHYILKDNCFFFAIWYDFARENSHHAEDTVLLHYADTIQASGCGHMWENPVVTSQTRIQRVRAFLDFLSNEDAEGSCVTNSIRLFHAACFPSHDRRFAITRNGRFCLVPGATKGGDLVCILSNSRVPYIFRPRTEGIGYQNIGETYVHGIMHGEMSEHDQYKETEFILY